MSWLIDTLVTTGVLIALVLVLRRPVSRHFGPGMAYALWALPLLRLALPPLVLPAPRGDTPASVGAGADDAVQFVANASASVAAPTFDPWPVIGAAWLVGAALFLGWRLGAYAVMRRRVLRAAVPVGRQGGVRIVESAAVRMPVAFGLIDRVVALPIEGIVGGDPLTRELVIAHEMQHHAGRDIAVNFAMQPLLALHWFNPLAWAGWRALRRDQEAACDARVLAGRDATTRATYARLIAAFARDPGAASTPPMACAVLSEKSIVHRLRSLTMHEPSPRRRLAGRLLLGAAVLALPLTASISYAAADDPAPAATPSPEVATKPVSHMERRMVIVDRQGPENGEAQVKTRTVTRDGTTVVFKTDKPLSDEEIEKRIDEALATAPLPPETPGEEGERRVAVRRVGPAGAASAMAFDTETVSGTNCRNGEPVEVNDTADADGKYRRLRIKICAREIAHAAAEGARAAALDAQAQAEIARDAARSARAEANQALRQARDEVARDKSIPENIRDKVVKDLDAEIERNAKQG